jgi:hypothetical protein
MVKLTARRGRPLVEIATFAHHGGKGETPRPTSISGCPGSYLTANGSSRRVAQEMGRQAMLPSGPTKPRGRVTQTIVHLASCEAFDSQKSTDRPRQGPILLDDYEASPLMRCTSSGAARVRAV